METSLEKGTGLGVWNVSLDENGAVNTQQESRQFPHSGAVMSSVIFDEGYLARLRRGDEDTAKHFTAYFRRMLRIKLWARFGRTVQDDLMNDVMAAAMEKIMNGEPRDPACLAGYVRGICANLARKPDPANQNVDINFDQICDHSVSAEEKMISQERARTVRTVLVTLKPRDRDILVDLFYNEMERDEVCRKHGVSREQLRLILFRARGRFQEKWPNN